MRQHESKLCFVAKHNLMERRFRFVDAGFRIGGTVIGEERVERSGRVVDRSLGQQRVDTPEAVIGGGSRYQRLGRHFIHRWLSSLLQKPARGQQEVFARPQLLVTNFARFSHV